VDPVGLEGSTLFAPDAADAVAATVDPTVPIDLIVAPDAASALAETVDPSVAFGATEFAGDLAEVVASAVIGNVAIRNAGGTGVNGTAVRTTLMIGI
jgi:hypothetical protein